MRGLNVYCCPNCGHYGFFQLVANAVCPHCSIAMTPLPIPYQDFMDLDYPQRQILISRHMINAASPLDSKAKQANKAKAPGQTKPSGRSISPDDAKSSDQNAAPDNTKLMTDHSAAPGKQIIFHFLESPSGYLKRFRQGNSLSGSIGAKREKRAAGADDLLDA